MKAGTVHRTAPKFLDLVKRDFTSSTPNLKWCGDSDMTETPTADEGKLYLATVLDLFSRRRLACPTSEHPDGQLACDAIKIAAAARCARASIDGRSSTATTVRPTPLRVPPSCVRTTRYQAVDGQCRILLRQRRRRIVLLQPSNTKSCPDTTSPPEPKHEQK
jgi:hypothetical protein